MDRIPPEVTGAWRDYVCDPARPGRYLSPLGSAVEGGLAPPADPAVLSDFLDALGTRREGDPILLADALDLTRADYLSFFRLRLPPLLDALASEHVAEEAVVGPVLRGHPDWGRTMLGRRTGALGPTQFIAKVQERSFALPENELVRWLVGAVDGCIARLAARTGGRVPRTLLELQDAVAEALSHPWFAEVEVPLTLEPHMLACAMLQRTPGYRQAAALAEARDRLSARDAAARRVATLDLLRANWLSPVDPDDLFELYALVLVLDVLEHDLGLGAPVEYGLVAPGRGHVARYSGTADVRVLFDQAPPMPFGRATAYSQVSSSHAGIADSPRRPDIVLLRQDTPRAVMVEVKRSANERYIADSVYKAFAYLRDFGALWGARPGSPKLLLLLPGDRVRPLPALHTLEAGLFLDGGPGTAPDDLVVCGEAHRGEIAAALRKALGLP